MIDHNRWRDQQLTGFTGVATDAILEQEQVMLNFVTQYPDVSWEWKGNNTNFKNVCRKYISIDRETTRGIIIFGQALHRMTSKSLVEHLTKAIYNFNYVYVAINRYELIAHDLDIELPDTIEASIDTIMMHCHPGFKRLHTFSQVDGSHMVAAHPMDCYGLCKL
jgi:hypothetical protein